MSPTNINMKIKLLNAAMQVLIKDGSTNLTTRKIALAAGTSTMSVYSNYGSIKYLIDALILSGFESLWSEMNKYTHTQNPLIKPIKYTKIYIKYARTYPELYKIMFSIDYSDKIINLKNTTTDKYFLELVFKNIQDLINMNMTNNKDAFVLSNEWLLLIHGYTLLELSKYYNNQKDIYIVFVPALTHFLIKLGANQKQVSSSIEQHFFSRSLS